MKNKSEKFKYLFYKYTGKDCTAMERIEFLEMVAQEDYVQLLKELIRDEVADEVMDYKMDEYKVDEIFNNIISVANTSSVIEIPSSKKYKFTWWAAAAVLLLATGGYFIFSKYPATKLLAKNSSQPHSEVNDLAPGHSGAILTLANGKKIILDSAHNGLLADEGNANVVKEDGQVSYNDKGNTGSKIMYNTMTTPKGRQYQLELADGSKVWLNAASSITFPTSFSGNERKVSISGEVYFEIKHLGAFSNSKNGEESIPFIVEIESANGKKREIKVLGTHFNVMAYGNETNVKTTLLEGSIKISNGNASAMVKPGEQAVIDNQNNNILLASTDVNEAVAWKNGFFSFKNASIETVMRQVERWYDVDVIYSGVKPKEHYRGEVPMNINASEMLKVLQVSGIHFQIEGKKILVM